MADDDLSEYVERVQAEWELRFRRPENGYELAEFAVHSLADELRKAEIAPELAEEVRRLRAAVAQRRPDLSILATEVLGRWDAIIGEDVAG